MGTHSRDIWGYNQQYGFIQANKSLVWNRSETIWEHVLSTPLEVDKLLSKAYKILLSSSPFSLNSFCTLWDRELNIITPDQVWEQIFKVIHKSSRASKTKEVTYKLVTRCHYTPVKLNRLFPSSSCTCWRCNNYKETHCHMWLTCPGLTSYWEEIAKVINKITKSEFQTENHALILLNIFPGSNKVITDPLTLRLLHLAKALIPLKWKSTAVPTFSEW